LQLSHEHGDGSWRAFRSALRGELPPRYGEGFRARFEACMRSSLREGVEILDVGAGRRPAIPLPDRPPRTRYVALDSAGAELELAPAGVYDDTIVADVVDRLPALEERFDLIVSWNVLEHVPSLETALANLRSYLRPGGVLVAQFASRFAAHALISRVTPGALGARAMERLLDRSRDTVFDAHYDDCRYSALDRLMSPFSTYAITPLYRDASYFRFSRLALALYLGYEQWALRRHHRNLASHYLVCAER
jgi:SAM-dependent methyltransferase